MSKQELPKELIDALKKVPSRPDENTPSIIMDFLGDNDAITKIFVNQNLTNTICDWVDPTLVDMDLDIRENDTFLYAKFAKEVVFKILNLIDLETKQPKSLDFYDKNDKIKKLRARDFTKLGNLENLSDTELCDKLEEHYDLGNDATWQKLTSWEKRLFVDKALSRQDTMLEKK